MIELCSQCMKPINLHKDAYYTGVRHGEHYFVHPICLDEWKNKNQ